MRGLEDVTVDSDATRRFIETPRPLRFVRVRLHLDTAEYLKGLLEDEQAAEYKALTELRAAGADENGPQISECRDNLNHLIQMLRDIDRGLIELVGPTPAPRDYDR